MKKLLAIVLCAAAVAGLTSCGAEKNDGHSSETTEAQTETGSASEDKHRLGLGITVSTAASKTGTAQVDATFAAVVTDKDGRITDCVVDTAQSKLSVADGSAATGGEYFTKAERGDEYGMKSASGIGKEWYEQAEAFSAYVRGKTAEEVLQIEVKTTDNGEVAAQPDLLSGCTVTITDMKEAVAKAASDKNAVAFSGSDFTLGAGAVTDDSSSQSATDSADGVAALYSAVAACVTDKGGNILAASVDEIQPKITFDSSGGITGNSYKGTKKEQGDDYGMRSASSIGKEWYQQAEAFGRYVTGMDAQAMESALAGDKKDDTLLSSCTVTVDKLAAALKKAMAVK